MHFSLPFLTLVAPILVSAAPWRRAGSSDVVVLVFADVLEQVETTFYSQALQKFQVSDFVAAGYSNPQIPIQQFTQIGKDESTHSSILQETIKANGGTPITNCKFDFSSVLTDVPTMAAAARLVENVGVGAYLGAASLVSDTVLLTAAATILTVEARHQTVLNLLNGATAIPQAFDIALTPPQVLAIAGGFISGCSLPITANPSLTVTNTGPIQVGTQLSFKSSAINGSMPTSKMFCQMLAGGLPFSISLPYDQCIVPPGIDGAVIIIITSDSQPLAASVVQQATSQLVAGPAMAFIDSQSDNLGQMIRTVGSSGSNNGSASSNSSSSASSTATSASASASSTAGVNLAGSSGNSSGTNTMGPAPNNATGPSPDGSVTVNGWTTVPSTSTTPM